MRAKIIKLTKNFAKKAETFTKLFNDLEKEWTGKISYSYLSENFTKFGIVIYNSNKKEIGESIQAAVLSNGLAKLDKEKPLDSSAKVLGEIEAKSSASNVGLWAENEVDEDEEEN